MKVAFYTPPASQRTGGLDLAIDNLYRQLQTDECTVSLDPLDPAAFDLVHFHGLWQPRFRSLAKRCLASSVPYVVSPHGMLEPWAWQHRWWKKWPYYFFFESGFLAHAAGLLATSEMEKNNLARFRSLPPVDVIPLGMTSDHGPNYPAARNQLGWTDDEFILLFLSRIHPKKGLHVLLEAIRRLSLSEKKVRLIVVGDGPKDYLRKLRQFVHHHELRLPAVTFTGPVWGPDKWTFLQGADLFCLPTFSENFGLAILEACQVGTPVLTTVHTPWEIFLRDRGFPVVQPVVDQLHGALAYFLNRGKVTSTVRGDLAEDIRRSFGLALVADRFRKYYCSRTIPRSATAGFVPGVTTPLGTRMAP